MTIFVTCLYLPSKVEQMNETFTSVFIGVLTAVLGGSIKALISQSTNIKVLESEHKSLQLEVNELKADIKESNTQLKADIDRRFDKMEDLIEKLFTFERDGRRVTDR